MRSALVTCTGDWNRLVVALVNALRDEIDGRPNTGGDTYQANWLSQRATFTSVFVTGATAAGRRAGEALSEGISPVQGTDVNGPTAVIRSATRLDDARTGGTLLNQKFTPGLLKGEKGIDNLLHLVNPVQHG